jgi:2-polyprenyl-3-methyl-5-hydroxy-6-metoxy-1,4-benzoquinol methylase
VELNETFNTDAALYEKVRPKYHKSIFNIIQSFIQVNESSSILEIGCGTGQATELFIESKAKIHCLDIGQNLIDVCNMKFKNYGNIDFENVQFEEYRSLERYDLVFSATAYHWIKQPEGDLKTEKLLKENGLFAIFRNHHMNINDSFYFESQNIYDKYMEKGEINGQQEFRIMNHNIFENVCNYEYLWNEEYNADEYINLLSTYSDHIALGSIKNDQLLNELSELINTKYNGKVRKNYMMVLEIGRKRDK